MFHEVSKLLWTLLQPSSVIALLVIAGSLLVCARAGSALARRLLALGVGLLVVCGYSPVGNMLILPLEERFPAEALPERPAAIILLGGFEIPSISRIRGGLALNEAGERLTEAARLARRLPGVPLAFSGGDGSILNWEGSGAGSVAALLIELGIERERIVLEPDARTTHENATLLRALLEPEPGRQFILVTSAYHMPRAVAVFRRQGFEVSPWPVDYRTRGRGDVLVPFGSLASGLERVDLVFREWVGLIAYRLAGRTDALWPGPAAPRRP